MKKLLGLLWITAMILMVLSGCGQKGEEESDPTKIEEPPIVDENPPEKEPEPDIEPVIPTLPYTFPLTGEGSEIDNTDRPVVVMVENSPAARPQSGLHQADIVYEILAEGDITRFMAVYQSETPVIIGPVRSIRPYNITIANGFDPIIVHAGWSPAAQKTLTDPNQAFATIDGVNGGGDHPYFWRSSERSAPNNLYTSMDRIRDRADNRKFRTESTDLMLKFVPDDYIFTGKPAEKVKIHYIHGYNVSYEYDPINEQYIRSLLGKHHKDKETDTQIVAHNILVAESSHKILDSVGRREINVTGPGNGLLIQKGKAVEVTWKRENGVIRAFKDDEELKWVPGNTWVQIVPIGSLVELE